ncbi:hypothetical protein BDZ97DRAFT_2017743 [Flammula alnicola]|nr:hypothetical protein BDZ97DRAFT_2017743 [Flammula alnicola]
MQRSSSRYSLFDNVREDYSTAAIEFIGIVEYRHLAPQQQRKAKPRWGFTKCFTSPHAWYESARICMAILPCHGWDSSRRCHRSVRIDVCSTVGQGTYRAQGVFIEMFIAAALVISVPMLAAGKHHVISFAPRLYRVDVKKKTKKVGIDLTLFAYHLFAVFYTGAAMNTAAFGPAVVSGFSVPNHRVTAAMLTPALISVLSRPIPWLPPGGGVLHRSEAVRLFLHLANDGFTATATGRLTPRPIPSTLHQTVDPVHTTEATFNRGNENSVNGGNGRVSKGGEKDGTDDGLFDWKAQVGGREERRSDPNEAGGPGPQANISIGVITHPGGPA